MIAWTIIMHVQSHMHLDVPALYSSERAAYKLRCIIRAFYACCVVPVIASCASICCNVELDSEPNPRHPE